MRGAGSEESWLHFAPQFKTEMANSEVVETPYMITLVVCEDFQRPYLMMLRKIKLHDHVLSSETSQTEDGCRKRGYSQLLTGPCTICLCCVWFVLKAAPD